MRELRAVISNSDVASLVLADVDNGEEFFLPVSDELRALLNSPADDADSADITPADETPTNMAPADTADTATRNIPSGKNLDQDKLNQNKLAQDSTADSTDKNSPAASASPEDTLANGFAKRTPGSRPRRASISLTPREIQDRIRHGATIAELSVEADTDESRIAPYAWPILQERANIADQAHSSRPVSADGPQQLTLWEALATSLAAHGVSLSEATWDAHQDASRRWVITVSWNKQAAGQTATHTAEFLLERTQSGAQLAHPLNSIAGDLTDPRYNQPVRTINPLGPSTPQEHHSGAQVASITDRLNPRGEQQHSPAEQHEDHEDTVPPDSQGNHANAATEPAERSAPQENFLLNPTADSPNPPGSREARNRRKRKAVTPHWEDVLLGVRTTPKKKR